MARHKFGLSHAVAKSEADMTDFGKWALEAPERAAAVDRSEAGSPDCEAADRRALGQVAAFPTLADGQRSAAQRDFPSAERLGLVLTAEPVTLNQALGQNAEMARAGQAAAQPLPNLVEQDVRQKSLAVCSWTQIA